MSGEAMSEAHPAPEWTADGHLAEPTVHAWLDGALAPAAADAVAAHAATCAACGALVAEVRGVIAGAARVVALLDAAPSAPLRGEEGGGGAPARVPPRAWYQRPAVLSLAATLLVAVGVRTVWQGGARPAAMADGAEARPTAEVLAGPPAELRLEVPQAERNAALTEVRTETAMKARATPAVSPEAVATSAPAPRMAVAPMAAAPMATAPMAPPPVASRSMAASEMVAADAAGTGCLLVEAAPGDGVALPPRMRLTPADGATAGGLAWVWDPPRSGAPESFPLRTVDGEALAGSAVRTPGMAVRLTREGDGWRGTVTAGDGRVRTFRLRPTDAAGCAGR